MNTNIKQMSMTELKALKSDIRDIIDLQQQNLSVLNAEITLRQQEQAKKDTEAQIVESVPAVPQPLEDHA